MFSPKTFQSCHLLDKYKKKFKKNLDIYNHSILYYGGLKRCGKIFRNFHHVDCKILAFKVTKIIILALRKTK